MTVNLYKDFQFHWWQGAIMALGMMSLGILVEYFLPNTLTSLIPFVWLIALAGTGYSLYRWLKS